MDGFHASDPDWKQEVVHFGARHMALQDGMWLQPEPLLHLGLTNGDLANPLGYLGLDAGGNPVTLHDREGMAPWALAWGALEVGATAADIGATAAMGVHYIIAGTATLGEFSAAAAGTAAGVVGPGGGAGVAVLGAKIADRASGALTAAKTLLGVGEDVAPIASKEAGTLYRGLAKASGAWPAVT